MRTFPVKEVGDFYNSNFINVRYDMDKKVGKAFRKLYPIKAYPTHFFINTKTKDVVHKFLGAKTPEVFIKEGEKVVKGLGLAHYQKIFDQKYANGTMSFDEFKKYSNSFFDAGKRDEASDLVAEYYEKNEGRKALLDKDKYDYYNTYLYSSISTRLFKDAVALRKRLEASKIGNTHHFETNISRMISIAVNSLISPVSDKDGEKPYLKVNKEQFELIKYYITALSDMPRMGAHSVQLVVYDKLIENKFEDAFSALRYATEFNIVGINEQYKLGVYKYIASVCGDKKLIKLIIADSEDAQENYYSKMPNGSIYDIIASFYELIGDKKKSKEIMSLHEEIASKRRERKSR